ncbi:MAG: hypothetical protein DRO23_01810 [Thermoprotei archaeon]|nr:MAG: hypothetical protein DRO23_01810 [Thermoprotei archaeon]
MVVTTIRVRAYASIANLGPGFDVLALAIDSFYDEVELKVKKHEKTKILVESILGPYGTGIPKNEKKHGSSSSKRVP